MLLIVYLVMKIHTLKCADDTTVLGLLTNSDESEYRDHMNELFSWSSEYNLDLNINKIKWIIGERNILSLSLSLSLFLSTFNRWQDN